MKYIFHLQVVKVYKKYFDERNSNLVYRLRDLEMPRGNRYGLEQKKKNKTCGIY